MRMLIGLAILFAGTAACVGLHWAATSWASDSIRAGEPRAQAGSRVSDEG